MTLPAPENVAGALEGEVEGVGDPVGATWDSKISTPPPLTEPSEVKRMVMAVPLEEGRGVEEDLEPEPENNRG
jgi:hypothetical protein